MAESLGSSVLDLEADDSGLRKGLEGAKDTAKRMGSAIGVAAGAAITAGAMEGVRREALGDQLAAQLDLTGQQSERAGRIAGDLYANAYGDSLEQVNSALQGVHTNIGELGDLSDAEIEDMGAKALDLAKIMGEDVSRVTRGVGQLMRNDMAPNAESAFDMIASAQSRVGQDMKGELIDTIEEYSSDFTSLGLNGEQSLAMITSAVEAGARNVDIAADGIREFSNRAVDGTDATRQAFEGLGMDADQMAQRIAEGGPQAREAMSEVIGALEGVGSEVKQERIGVALFGTRFEEMGMDAVAAMDPVEGSLDNVEGSADRMGDTLNENAQTKIDTFTRKIEGMLAKVVEAPGLLGDGAAAVAGFGQAIEPMGPAITGVGLIFGQQIAGMVGKASRGMAAIGLAAAKGAARTTASVGKMVAGWALLGIKSLLHAAKVAAAWLIAMGPIGLIIAAVVGLVALIIANWDTVWKTTKRIFTAVWNWLKGLWKTVTGFIGTAIEKIKGIFFKFHPLGIIIKNWGKITGWVSDQWKRISGFVSNGIGRIVGFIKGLPGRALDAVGNLHDLLIGKAQELIQGFIDGIKNKFGDVKDTLGDLTGKLTSWKGPARVDRVLLEEPAEDIMGGFADSLDAEARRVVQPTLAQLTADLKVSGERDRQRGGSGDMTVENLNVQAWSDRFDLAQVEEELTMAGAV